MGFSDLIIASKESETDIYSQLASGSGSVTVVRKIPDSGEFITVQEAATVLKSRDVSGDSIWGRDDWHEAYWDGAYASSQVFINVINPNNKYREYFETTLFKNSSTTADWSTSNERIDFDNGEIAYSEPIFKNNQTVYYATPKITYTGTITIQLSANGGSNYQTFTNNTRAAFTTTGTDLRFKLTSTGTSQVTYIEIEYEV